MAKAEPKRTVCVVEDSTLNRLILTSILEKAGVIVVDGYRADLCERIAVIVAAAKNNPHDEPLLVFMDVQMPNVDGKATTIALAQHEPPVRADVVIQTAESKPTEILDEWKAAIQSTSSEVRIRTILSKPIDTEALARALADEDTTDTEIAHEQQPIELDQTLASLGDDLINIVKNGTNKDATKAILIKILDVWDSYVDDREHGTRLYRILCHTVKNTAVGILSDEADEGTFLRHVKEIIALIHAIDETYRGRTRMEDVISEIKNSFKGEFGLTLTDNTKDEDVSKSPWHFIISLKNLVHNAKTAGAKNVEIELATKNGKLILRVLDDGAPFPKNWCPPEDAEPKGSTGNGLRDIMFLGFCIKYEDIHGLPLKERLWRMLQGKPPMTKAIILELANDSKIKPVEPENTPTTVPSGSMNTAIDQDSSTLIEKTLIKAIEVVGHVRTWLIKQLNRKRK